MRKIETHKVDGLNEALEICAVDGPGPGGASHVYDIYVDATKTTVAVGAAINTRICFQKGGIVEVGGVNGLSGEALLAIVRDRLEGFQSGAFACPENQEALDYVVKAMEVLHARTLAREARGVEGRSIA